MTVYIRRHKNGRLFEGTEQHAPTQNNGQQQQGGNQQPQQNNAQQQPQQNNAQQQSQQNNAQQPQQNTVDLNQTLENINNFVANVMTNFQQSLQIDNIKKSVPQISQLKEQNNEKFKQPIDNLEKALMATQNAKVDNNMENLNTFFNTAMGAVKGFYEFVQAINNAVQEQQNGQQQQGDNQQPQQQNQQQPQNNGNGQ